MVSWVAPSKIPDCSIQNNSMLHTSLLRLVLRCGCAGHFDNFNKIIFFNFVKVLVLLNEKVRFDK